jgi:hypothetical protein
MEKAHSRYTTNLVHYLKKNSSTIEQPSQLGKKISPLFLMCAKNSPIFIYVSPKGAREIFFTALFNILQLSSGPRFETHIKVVYRHLRVESVPSLFTKIYYKK